MESYTGNPFVNQEMVDWSLRHIEFNWTLNQEVLFSTTLPGKPLRKEAFNEYKWDRYAIGFQDNSPPATQYPACLTALNQGKLWDLRTRNNELLIFAPANNTDYSNVSAYLEAFWGCIWPAVSHNYLPMVGKWSVPKHGLKEFVDHPVSMIGREQIKPTTKCLRGVATFLEGSW